MHTHTHTHKHTHTHILSVTVPSIPKFAALSTRQRESLSSLETTLSTFGFVHCIAWHSASGWQGLTFNKRVRSVPLVVPGVIARRNNDGATSSQQHLQGCCVPWGVCQTTVGTCLCTRRACKAARAKGFSPLEPLMIKLYHFLQIGCRTVFVLHRNSDT